MQFTNEVIITGAKLSKGEMEGRPYDNTKLYIQTDMNQTTGEMVGTATVEYNWGTSDNFHTIKAHQYPMQAKVTFEQVTTGRNTKLIVVDVQPIKQANKAS